MHLCAERCTAKQRRVSPLDEGEGKAPATSMETRWQRPAEGDWAKGPQRSGGQSDTSFGGFMPSGLERSPFELRCCSAHDVTGEKVRGVVPVGVAPVPSTMDSKLYMPAEGVWIGTPATSVNSDGHDTGMLPLVVVGLFRALLPSEFVNTEVTAREFGRENLGARPGAAGTL